jgi:hypothetical protein
MEIAQNAVQVYVHAFVDVDVVVVVHVLVDVDGILESISPIVRNEAE